MGERQTGICCRIKVTKDDDNIYSRLVLRRTGTKDWLCTAAQWLIRQANCLKPFMVVVATVVGSATRITYG
jgi:hypothetical protein